MHRQMDGHVQMYSAQSTRVLDPRQYCIVRGCKGPGFPGLPINYFLLGLFLVVGFFRSSSSISLITSLSLEFSLPLQVFC